MSRDQDIKDDANPSNMENSARNDGWRGQNKDFNAQENDGDFDANADLPSLTRRRNSKLVTTAGYAFMGLLALAAVLAMTRTPSAPAEKTDDAKISNRLPPLVVPPPKPPAPVAQIATAPEPEDEDDVMKRKMGGNLVAQGGASPSSTGRTAPSRADMELERMQRLTGPGAGGGFVAPDGSTIDGAQSDAISISSSGGPSTLGQRLKPTVTEAVAATVLPRRDYLLAKGATLDCALETAIDSSVPGMATCRLTRDVYSDNGRVLLLDRGTQLVGEYAGALQRGQARMFLLWTRAKTPAGVAVNLNSPGTDSLGRSGISGYVDNHFWERFGAAILTSFIKDTVNTVVNNRTKKDGAGGDINNIYGGTVQSGEQVVSAILKDQANIPPTMHVNQGEHIQILVARDLDFSQVYGLRAVQ